MSGVIIEKYEQELTNLQKSLDKNLSYRKQELAILKTEIDNARGRTLNTFLRAGVLLLYSHWEGFIKDSAKEYLRFLNRLNLQCSDIKDNFFVAALKGSIIDISKSKKTSKHYELYTAIAESSKITFKVNVDSSQTPIIETHSNLKWEYFKEILFILGLDEFEDTNHQFIDSILLDRRNKIAHGERFQILKAIDSEEENRNSISEYNDYHKKIIGLLEEFKDNILDSAVNQGFLK